MIVPFPHHQQHNGRNQEDDRADEESNRTKLVVACPYQLQEPKLLQDFQWYAACKEEAGTEKISHSDPPHGFTWCGTTTANAIVGYLTDPSNDEK